MLETPAELAAQLGARIRASRKAMGLSQAQAAERAGLTYATWRRLEAKGAASIEALARAAIALRAEEGVRALFPAPPPRTLDELVKRAGR